MSQYPAGDLKIRGVTFTVTVTDHGTWCAEYLDREVTAPTKTELAERLMALTARQAAKVSVPFTTRMPRAREIGRVVHGTATGIHQGNGNVLVNWGSGKNEQDTKWGTASRQDLRRLTDEEVAEWNLLTTEFMSAREALNTFERERRISLKDTVAKAIEAAITRSDQPS